VDNHERGWEKKPGRLDLSLPEWRGGYGGDPRRLPRVIQKLLHGRKLTAEEKAELLWRFYELDQEARAGNRKRVAVLLTLGTVVLAAAAWVCLHPPKWLVQSLTDLLTHPGS
jgi:hypothetical protein